MDSQEEKSQYNQHCIDDPHEYTYIPLGKKSGQYDGQTGGSTKRKMVGRFKNGNSYCGEDQSQVENQEKNQVVFCKYFLFHKLNSPSLDILSIT